MVWELLMDRINTALLLEGGELRSYLAVNCLTTTVAHALRTLPRSKLYPGLFEVDLQMALALLATKPDSFLVTSTVGKDDLHLKKALMERLQFVKQLHKLHLKNQ